MINKKKRVTAKQDKASVTISPRLARALAAVGQLEPGALPSPRGAYHEAGHAVVDLHLGIGFTWVISYSEGGLVNAAAPHDMYEPGGTPIRSLAQRCAVGMYAGAAAEARLGQGVAQYYADFDVAETWLETHCGFPAYRDDSEQRQFDAVVRRLRARADALVAEHWHAIEAVAAALLRLEALEYDEVVTIAGGGRAPRR